MVYSLLLNSSTRMPTVMSAEAKLIIKKDLRFSVYPKDCVNVQDDRKLFLHEFLFYIYLLKLNTPF